MMRVLHILGSMNTGGMQSFIMNHYRRIDRTKVQFDFLVHYSDDKGYEEEIKKLGGKIYLIHPRNKGILRNKRELFHFFKEHNDYSAVHLHESSLSYIQPLIAAANAHIPIRIIHSHSTQVKSNSRFHLLMHYINSPRLNKYATKCLSCGKAAGEWMFGNTAFKDDYTVINNGIEIDKFQFDSVKREKIREKFGIENHLVIGMVGRLEPVKNHFFALNIMEEMKKTDQAVILMVAGDGSLMNRLKETCRQKGLEKNVLFLGGRNDVNELYSAMDCIIMPSLYEGFPVTAIEAQISGLPFIKSTTITDEVVFNPNVVSMDIDIDVKYWVDKIREIKLTRIREYNHSLDLFDIRRTTSQLMDIYQVK